VTVSDLRLFWRLDRRERLGADLQVLEVHHLR
jgi:hypothetical protein